jgi:hypothetical protein
MNLADITARVTRLERLSIGLAKEIYIWQQCNDPLLYVERREFLNAMRDVHSGIESARVALVKAKQRLQANHFSTDP